MQEGARTSPLLTASGKLAETEVRRILRRVTAPANKKEAKATMKPLGRMLAKIAHAAPLPVAEQLIRQVCMPVSVFAFVQCAIAHSVASAPLALVQQGCCFPSCLRTDSIPACVCGCHLRRRCSASRTGHGHARHGDFHRGVLEVPDPHGL